MPLTLTAPFSRWILTCAVLFGIAASTADAFALFARFESKLEQHNGNLPRSVVELAKEWRTDRVLRHLEMKLEAVGFVAMAESLAWSLL